MPLFLFKETFGDDRIRSILVSSNDLLVYALPLSEELFCMDCFPGSPRDLFLSMKTFPRSPIRRASSSDQDCMAFSNISDENAIYASLPPSDARMPIIFRICSSSIIVPSRSIRSFCSA